MTKILFYDSAITYFEAKVINKEISDEGYQLILDQTAFFPTGGGMEYDRGTINDVAVEDVFWKDGQIIHIVKKDITDQSVIGKIDKLHRFRRIQLHDAQHLLSALFEKRYQALTVSHHVYQHYCDIDLACDQLTSEMLTAIETEANQLIIEQTPIITMLIPKNKLEQYGIADHELYRDPVRIVNIESVDDMNPCGCLHFDNLQPVQAIKLLSFEKTTRGYRLYFTAGLEMLDYFQRKLDLLKNICKLTTSNETTVITDMENLLAQNQNLSKANKQLTELLLQNEINQLCTQKSQQNFVGYSSNIFNFEELRKLAILVNNLTEPLIALLQVQQETGFQFILCKSQSVTLELTDIFNKLKEKYQVVGGGKGFSINGKSTVCLLDKIESLL